MKCAHSSLLTCSSILSRRAICSAVSELRNCWLGSRFPVHLSQKSPSVLCPWLLPGEDGRSPHPRSKSKREVIWSKACCRIGIGLKLRGFFKAFKPIALRIGNIKTWLEIYPGAPPPSRSSVINSGQQVTQCWLVKLHFPHDLYKETCLQAEQ